MTCIHIVVGVTVKNEVVGGPICDSVVGACITADLNTCVTVTVSVDIDKHVVVTGKLEALLTVSRACYVEALEDPPVTAVDHTEALTAEVDNGTSLRIGICDKTDRLFLSTVKTALDLKSLTGIYKFVSTFHKDDGLTGNRIVDSCYEIVWIFLGACAVVNTVYGNVNRLTVIVTCFVYKVKIGINVCLCGKLSIFAKILIIVGIEFNDEVVLAVRLKVNCSVESFHTLNLCCGNNKLACFCLDGNDTVNVGINREGVFTACCVRGRGKSYGRSDIGDRSFLCGSIILRIDGCKSYIGEGCSCITGSVESCVNVLGIKLIESCVIIVLDLISESAVLVIISDEVTGVVSLDLKDHCGEEIVKSSLNGSVSVVTNNVIRTAVLCSGRV